MDRFEYTFMVGMDAEEVRERLEAAEAGVLALARGGDAYAVPLAYHYEDGAFVFRLGDREGSEKVAFLDATDRACFLVWDADPPEAAWSIMAHGRLRALPAERAAALDEREDFLPLRVFGEAVEDLETRLVEFDVEALTGRKVPA